MNAGAPQKINSAQDFINAVDQFHQKVANKTVQKKDVDHFAEIITSTPRPKLDQLVANRLDVLKKAIGTIKGEIEKVAGAQPTQGLIAKIDELTRYLKSEEERHKKVISKENDGLPRR